MQRKKILYHSNFSRILTGFGKNAKNVLQYLHSTGKYDIVELSNGTSKGHPELSLRPWKCVGGIPSDKSTIDRINRDPNLSKSAQYGSLCIDDIIKEEKPDIYIGVEDVWGLSTFIKKPWWNKINCMIWTTLDSLPILPDAVKIAPKVKNYYTWASFASKAMNSLGYDHVKTLRGALDVNKFYRLTDEERLKLRSRFNLSPKEFVIGFVFRNQLRKSVPNLLDGFSLFKKENPLSNAKLLLHTNFSEGWDIPRFLQEKGIDPKDVLCTYYCPKCKNYEIKPFQGQKLDCRYCGSKKSQNTVNITDGVNDSQLNEIYNLMDVYCHPFTSGGQEIPIQEAKLTELITLVTNYSCGEDCCTDESGGLPLDWSEYREPGTQFIKASTRPASILKNLKKVYNMKPDKLASMGKKSRDFVVNNYSTEVIGKKLESILDGMPDIDYDFSFEPEVRDPNYQPPVIESDSEWLIHIYKNILKVDLDDKDEGHKHWMKALNSKSQDRKSILDYFRSVAVQENTKNKRNKSVDFEEVIKNSGKKRALLIATKNRESVFMSSMFVDSFSRKHPDCDIFFATKPEFYEILNCSPSIYKTIRHDTALNDEIGMLGGRNNSKKYFDFYINFDVIDSSQNYLGVENNTFNTSFHE
jgi:glycosyltransferase involved in cell wall biosynthesis